MPKAASNTIQEIQYDQPGLKYESTQCRAVVWLPGTVRNRGVMSVPPELREGYASRWTDIIHGVEQEPVYTEAASLEEVIAPFARDVRELFLQECKPC